LAYSLNDLYSGLRSVMRVDGLVVGVGAGLLLLLFPRGVMNVAGLYTGEAVWPYRLIGSLLLSLGAMLLISAQDRVVSTASMVAMIIANALMAIVLLIGYMQGELVGLGLFGQIGLVLIFLICLISAIVPVRYLRTDYVVL
jgi:integral membrane sensor domain MASE1